MTNLACDIVIGEPLLVRALVTKIADKLAHGMIESPRRDANLLLQLALGRQEPLLTYQEVCLDESALKRLHQLIDQRLQGCPVSRLRGNREFYSLLFDINDHTLDPRPDSETLVAAAIQECGSHAFQIADFGTGSGCLLISMLVTCENATGIGLDLSKQAIAQASQNAARHGVEDRTQFLISDWDSGLEEGAQFDIIISNPPYIPRHHESDLAPEVRLYDPALALYGGDDGLVAYRQLLPIIADRLKASGCVLIEIGKGQEADVEKIALAANLIPDTQFTDLAGIIRCLKFVKSPFFS